MKKQVLFFSLLLFLCQASLLKSEKYALLIGIGAYPENSEWQALAGDKDVVLMKKVFMEKGIAESNIFTIAGTDATRERILQAMDDMKKRLRNGDMLVFHFSGHGQQIQDFDGDEADGRDEAIVPYDSPKDYIKGVYEGQNLITDDVLRTYFTTCRTILGKKGHLLVLMDACHSGTATRGLKTSRGTSIVMGESPTNTLFASDPSGEAENAMQLVDEDKELASMVAMYSSAPHQQSYEYSSQDGESFGMLSYFFAQRFLNGTDRLTYGRLFNFISRDIATQTGQQRPVLEGDQNLLVLGSGRGKAIQFFRILEASSEDEVRIDGGKIHHLSEGTIVSFYGEQIHDTTGVTPIARGEVVYADVFSCDVRLFDFLSSQLPLQSNAVILANGVPVMKQHVFCRCDDTSFVNKIRDIVKEFSFLQYDSVHADLILEEKAGGKVDLYSRNDILLLRNTPILEISKFRKSILDYARAHFLKIMHHEEPSFEFELAFLDSKGQALPPSPILTLDQQVQLSLTNRGQEAFYFHLIDINPEYKPELLTKAQFAEDYYLQPGVSFTSPVFNVIAPKGRDVIKIILSRVPIEMDLGSAGQSRGYSSNSNHPFTRILQQITQGKGASRGVATSLPSNSGGIYSYFVDIE